MCEITLPVVLDRLEANDPLTTKEMLVYRSQKNSITELITSLKSASLAQRINAVGLVVDLGRIMISADDILPERPGPIVVNTDVISYLVEQLNDEAKEIRNKTCLALAALVPGSMLKQYSGNIVTSLKKYPYTDGAIILLGKTGSEKAIPLLKTAEIAGSSAKDSEMALARLGDEHAEKSVIDDYKNSLTPQEKAIQARRLGYVASDRTTKLLAEEMRTPEYYEWISPAKRSLRVHIIEGLHLAFMEEPLFWQPLIHPTDDSYYENIEIWLTEKLGIQWKTDRPEFLYQLDAPSPPPALQ